MAEETQSDKFKRSNKIDYLGDFPGARVAKDAVGVIVEAGEVDIGDNPLRQLGVVSVNSVPDDISVSLDSADTIGVTQEGDFVVTDDGNMVVTVPNTVEVTQTSGGQFTIQENNPLDVSGAVVTVTDDGSLTVDDITSVLSIQEDTPLDVSASVVSIQEDTALDVSASTVETDPNTSDSDSLNSATLSADGELRMSLDGNGAVQINGQVTSTGGFGVDIEWKNSDGTVIRTETVKSNISAGNWADINQSMKSSKVDVVVRDNSSAEQTVEATVHTG